MATSGTYSFQPSVADFIVESFARLKIYAPQLTTHHLIEARRSANLILTDWSGNRGVNLWSVEQINIPLTPGQTTFSLPSNTVELLDVYLRTFTLANPATYLNLGNAAQPLGPANNPLVTQPYGDPVLLNPGNGTMNSVAGDMTVTMNWPAHGQVAGNPLFWQCPFSIGGVSVSGGFSIVDDVIDSNTLSFLLPSPAVETQTNEGVTPLFYIHSGSSTVNCIQPNHGQSVGDTYVVPIATTLGNQIISGSYTVTAVASSSQFSFAGATANADAMAFENNGRPSVATQAAGVQMTDVLLFPLSRNDYAALPLKAQPGRPTSFWFDRTSPPSVSLYPIAEPNSYWGFMAYRLRDIQDANPVSGQTIDLPKRFYLPFVAALAAALAEKFAQDQWAAKIAAAEAAWDRAASEDREMVTTHIVPVFSGYFR